MIIKAKSDKYLIYSLNHPITNEVRYIGLTSRTIEKRLMEHMCDKHPSRKKSWIISLKSNNLKPLIEIIEDNISRDNIEKAEITYIKEFKKLGANLINNTSGGAKIVDKDSEFFKEMCKRISENNKKPKSKEHCLAMSKGKKGKTNWRKGKTKYDLEKAKLLFSQGMKMSNIAKIIGCDVSHISRVINNKTQNRTKK